MATPADDRARRIVLVGMMGSGKTTIGRRLAVETGWPFQDNDEILAELYGKNARELFEESGEEQLRMAESAALTYGLSQLAPAIIDAAAGTILSADSRAALRDPIVV